MLIALSGGADSVALLLMMLEEGKVEAAAHCNFHLRGEESDRDEAFVRQLCKERGVKLFVTHFDTLGEVSRTGESIEMAARRLRYDWFARLCREHHFREVAVAHHRDDNAETVLLNLIRGTGLRGLTGMSAEREGVVRPLLKYSRQQILDYLAERHQSYVTDSTNADTHYRRNKIRHEVLPLLRTMNGKIEQTLNDMAQRLEGVESIYRYGLDVLRKQLVTPAAFGKGFTVSTEKLLQAPSPACLLYEWLSPYGFTAAQCDEALNMRVGALLECGDMLLTRTARTLELRQRPEPCAPQKLSPDSREPLEVNGLRFRLRSMSREELTAIPREPNVVALDADALSGGLTLRTVQPSDRFRPFGMKGSKLVSDYLTDRHYSRIDKMSALVVADEDGIVWLVNERPAQRVALTAQTKRVIIIHTEK